MKNVKRIFLLLLTLSIVGIVFVNLGNYYSNLQSGESIPNINEDTTKMATLYVSCTDEVDSVIPVSTTFDLKIVKL